MAQAQGHRNSALIVPQNTAFRLIGRYLTNRTWSFRQGRATEGRTMPGQNWMTWVYLERVLRKHWQTCLIASLAVTGPVSTVSNWMSPASGGSTGLKRWNAGGGTYESNLFKLYSRSSAKERGLTVEDAAASDPTSPDPNHYWAPPDISVYSVPSIPPPQSRLTLKDLGDRAQVRAIDAIEKVSASPTRPGQNLRPALFDTDEPAAKDPFLFERVLVVSVAKGTAWSSGDRMVWTRVLVHPINFRFAAYDIASTENETVKVSSVEATDTRKVSAEMSLTVPGLKDSKVGVTPERESSVKATSDISTQYERLGVDIIPTFLRVIRESSAGSDVLGNTKVALSITTDPDLILNGVSPRPEQPDTALVVTEFHETDDAEDATMKVLPLAPLPHCALQADVWSIYEQRHVNSGNEFYDESQQNVTFMRDVVVKRTVDIVGADDISPYVWQIQLVPAKQQPKSDWQGRDRLQARLHDGSPRKLIFSDFGRAQKFAHWVRTHGGQGIRQYQLNYGESEAKAGMGLAVVKNTQDVCKAKETPLVSTAAPKQASASPRSNETTTTASVTIE
jgi:hypothetical protein